MADVAVGPGEERDGGAGGVGEEELTAAADVVERRGVGEGRHQGVAVAVEAEADPPAVGEGADLLPAEEFAGAGVADAAGGVAEAAVEFAGGKGFHGLDRVVGEAGELPPEGDAVLDGAGGEEDGGGDAEFVEDGRGVEGVVGPAVVEGDREERDAPGAGGEGGGAGGVFGGEPVGEGDGVGVPAHPEEEGAEGGHGDFEVAHGAAVGGFAVGADAVEGEDDETAGEAAPEESGAAGEAGEKGFCGGTHE